MECLREAPALARIHQEFKDRKVDVVAINILPQAPLAQWRDYWQGAGGGDVIYAQDARHDAVRAFQIQSVGSTVIVNRQGREVFRNGRAVPYEILKPAVERALK